ncbi:hypothetical protein AB1Y20_023398 [Prymnesium parvum]|uniref:Large ribosomal subunit protein bL28m n=1 Tax=Prymnesium parvum TaxID=97485 RepID=A0AB34JGW5_PRYPA
MWASLKPVLLKPLLALPALARGLSAKHTQKTVQGKRMVMGRAFRGLYGLKQIQFGNQICFSNKKSRRTWKPNVQRKKFYSGILEEWLRFRMTTSVMKQIKRMKFGIDEYLLKTPDDVLLYDRAIKLKKEIKEKAKQKADRDQSEQEPEVKHLPTPPAPAIPK